MSSGEKKVSLMNHISSAPDSAKMYIVLADGSYGYITKAEFLSGISGGSSGLSFHANTTDFPTTGNITTLYIDKSNEQIYRWNGTGYVAQDWQNQSDVLLKGNRPTKFVNLDDGDYTFVAGDERKVIFFYGSSNTSVIKFPNQIDGSTPFKEGDELICINSNDPTETTGAQAFDVSNIGVNGDSTAFKFYSVVHIRLFAADGYGWHFSYESSHALTPTYIDALKRDGSNANSAINIGSNDFVSNAEIGAKSADNIKFTTIHPDNGVKINTNGNFIGQIKSTYLNSGDEVFELPDKGGSGGTLAVTSDIPSMASYATTSYVDGKVAGLLDLRGNHDANGNAYPSSGGSGTAGAILKGDFWYISVAGTLGGVAVNIGDSIYALVDTPGSTSANWAVMDANIGYVPENTSNKSTSVAADLASNTKFPSVKAVYDWAVGLFAPKSDYMVLSTAYVLSNTTSLQKMFNVGSGSAGAFNTTANKTYKFRIEFDMTGLSSSAGTLSFGFLGTAAISSISYKAETSKQVLATAAAPFLVSIQVATISTITSSTTGTACKGVITGVVRCTTAGTLIPAIATSIGVAAAQVEANSNFEITEVGANTITATSNIS